MPQGMRHGYPLGPSKLWSRDAHCWPLVMPTIEVSTTTPPIVLATLSNKSSQSTVTSSSIHTQSRNLGRSMVDEMRLPIFRGDGSEDPNQHWFLCEAVWSIKQVNDKVVKRA
jgi:hypothetical protein